MVEKNKISRQGAFCCAKCFNHPWLVAHVRARAQRKGTCRFCGSKNVLLTDVKELVVPFHNLLDMYSLVNDENTLPIEDDFEVGEFLNQLLQEDWEVFSDRLWSANKTLHLLEAILNAKYNKGEWIFRQIEYNEYPFDRSELYTRRDPLWESSPSEELYDFISKIRKDPSLDLEYWIPKEYLKRARQVLSKGTIVYRARNGFAENEHGVINPYCGTQLGAPPPKRASAGRANKEGESVLYCADQEATAVAEVRPARGFFVSVGELHILKDVSIIDLTSLVDPINPFTTSSLRHEVKVVQLLEDFGRELGRPLNRGDRTSDYTPTQKLAAYFRDEGLGGIRYPSAMQSNGTNLVLFDPSVVEVGRSYLVEITEVDINYRPH